MREAESNRKSNEKEYEYYKKQYDTLKKEGPKGKYMRDIFKDEIDNGDNYESPWGAKDAYEQYLEGFSMDMDNYKESVKAYTKYAEKLKNIDISDLSDKDVTRKGKEALNEAWNEVMAEWREAHKDEY